MKRYMILGLATVLALSLAVPALGGPSNPVAKTAVSAAKALKVAKKAKQNAASAQATANQALSNAAKAQTAANTAQTAANNANTEAGDVSANDLNASLEFTQSASDSTTPKSVSLNCDAGQEPISIIGAVNEGILPPEEVDFDGGSWFYGAHVVAHEESALAGNWYLASSGICIDSTG